MKKLSVCIFIILFSCTETKTENKTPVKKEKECKDYTIEDIPIRSLIGMSSGARSTYDFIVNNNISKCIWQNHSKEEIRMSYYKNKHYLSKDQLVLYFTLFGIMKDSTMLPELNEFVQKADNKSMVYNDDIYFFAKRSIDEIEGVKPSIIEIEPYR